MRSDYQPDDEEVPESIRQLRAEPRQSMLLLASVRRPGGADVAVKVRNLSSGGMMAECPGGFGRGGCGGGRGGAPHGPGPPLRPSGEGPQGVAVEPRTTSSEDMTTACGACPARDSSSSSTAIAPISRRG